MKWLKGILAHNNEPKKGQIWRSRGTWTSQSPMDSESYLENTAQRSFSGFRLYMKHLGFLLRYRLRFSKSGWGLRVYIANKLLNGAEAAVL